LGGEGGEGGGEVWVGETTMLRCHLAFRFLDFVCLKGKRNSFSMNLDVFFVDRFPKVSDIEASNSRIILNFEVI
jgi:hypothetical protein